MCLLDWETQSLYPPKPLMKDTGEKKVYVSYLLRMWQTGGSKGADIREAALWRASLQNPLSGERFVFASLEELFCYLQRQTGRDPLATGQAEDE